MVAVSGRRQAAFDWIMETEAPNASFEALADPGDFETLDAKLNAAINDISKGKIGKLLVRQTKKLAMKGVMITGRQLLYIIYGQFALDQDRGTLYSFSQLMSITFPGDDKLELFLTVWDETVEGLEVEQPDHVLETMLFDKLAGTVPGTASSKKLAMELSRYELAKK